MEKTCQILKNLVQNLTIEEATTWRDSGHGWTVTEVMCHLRDFDRIFMGRAHLMLEKENADLGAYDHEEMAILHKYNQQNLFTVLAELQQHRALFVQFYRDLTPEQWGRSGNHPERDSFDMLDSLMQVGLHDATHIEQISRIIAEKV